MDDPHPLQCRNSISEDRHFKHFTGEDALEHRQRTAFGGPYLEPMFNIFKY